MKSCIVAIFVTLALAGCAAIGPTDEQDIAIAVARDLPKDAGSPKLYGQASWMPNAKGFTAQRSAFISSGGQVLPGVLTITDAGIWFQQWDDNEKRFSVVKKIDITDVKEVTLDEYGLNRAVVIRDHRYQYDSFSFTKGSGGFVAPAKTADAYRLLSDLVHK